MANDIEVRCKILRFEDNPRGGQNVFIECNIGQRTWIKQVWCNYDRPVSFEEFKLELKKKVWAKNEDDNLRFIKEEAEKEFVLKVQRDNDSKDK